MSARAPAGIGTLVHSETPYKGLMPFAEEDAAFFFGRDEWREIIVDNLRAFRLTLLYGDSGVGKTSVLRAGVVHELGLRARRNREEGGLPGLAVAIFRTWRAEPLAGLVRCLHRAVADVLEEEATEPLPPFDLAATIEVCTRRVGGKLLVILDQFEEYFLYHPEEAGEGTFADAFARVANRRDLPANFLISIREDALAKLDRFKGRVPNLFDNFLRIEQLDRDEAREAIEGPLAEYNRRTGDDVAVAPGLVDAVLEQVQTGKVVVGQTGAGVVDAGTAAGVGRARIETPYLQLVLTRLWSEERRAGSRVLRPETFTRLGGAQGIVRTHLDAAMSALSPTDQEVAAQLFNHLVTPSGTKIAQGLSDLAGYAERPEAEAAPILERLSGEVRILRPVGEEVYEIYHDALAAPILDWRARWQEAQRRRRDRRRIRILGSAALVSGLVALGVIVLAVAALNARNRAKASEEEARRSAALVSLARSKDLARDAVSRAPTAPRQALRLALEADELAPTAEARGALRAAVSQPILSAVLRSGRRAVVGAVFSPNSALLATTSADGATRLWRTTDGAPVATLDGRSVTKDRGKPIARSAVFDPAGRFVVTTGEDGSTRVWRADGTGQVTVLRGHTGAVLGAAFSRDGRSLVTAGRDGTARVWDTSSWRSRAVLDARAGEVPDADLNADGTRAVTIGRDGTTRVWDVAGGRITAVLRGEGPSLESSVWVADVSVAFSPGGARVLTVSPADGAARLWGVARKLLLVTVRARNGVVNSASFSPDGRLFVTATDDASAVVYRTRTGQRVKAVHMTHSVLAASFTPDGTQLAAADAGGGGAVWDLASGQRFARLSSGTLAIQPRYKAWSAAVSPDGRHVALAHGNGTTRLWELPRERAPVAVTERAGRLVGVTFSPNGRLVVASSPSRITRVWRATNGRRVAALPGCCADFGAGGRKLLLRGSRRGVQVWAAETWRARRGLSTGLPYWDADLSPDGRLVAVVEHRGIVSLWEAASGARAGSIRIDPRFGASVTSNSTHPFSARFTPDGSRILVLGRGAPVEVRDLASRRRIGRLGSSGGWVCNIAVSPDSEVVATAGDDGIRLWHLPTRRRLHVLTEVLVCEVAFSRDGRLVAATNSERTWVWNASTGTRVAAVRGSGVELSPDGELAITVFRGKPTIWGATTGQLLAVLPGRTAAFSPDGRRIATTNADGTVRVYGCDLCGSVEQLRALARRRLGSEQR